MARRALAGGAADPSIGVCLSSDDRLHDVICQLCERRVTPADLGEAAVVTLTRTVWRQGEGGQTVASWWWSPAMDECGAADRSLVLCFGNPMVDLSLAADQAFLADHRLDGDDDHPRLDADARAALFAALEANPELRVAPGGSALNTARVAAWFLEAGAEEAKKTCARSGFVGCIGTDPRGTLIASSLMESGVDCFLARLLADPSAASDHHQPHQTESGACGVVIRPSDGERLLFGRPGASRAFRSAFLKESVVASKAAAIVYLTGYVLTFAEGAAAATYLFDLVAAARANEAEEEMAAAPRLALSLSAARLAAAFADELVAICRGATYVFGNRDEVVALATAAGLVDGEVDGRAASEALSRLVLPGGVVFTTCGSDPTVVACAGTSAEVSLTDVIETVVDTNGAGDAFAGGVLAGLAMGESPNRAVKRGQYAAAEIVQRVGCQLPDGGPSDDW